MTCVPAIALVIQQGFPTFLSYCLQIMMTRTPTTMTAVMMKTKGITFFLMFVSSENKNMKRRFLLIFFSTKAPKASDDNMHTAKKHFFPNKSILIIKLVPAPKHKKKIKQHRAT